jgi:tetratricopeptide (TPR) repeat protein
MQYKAQSELPRSIRKKFVSLAGLLEIGDREFQSIEVEFDELRSSVKTGFEEDLTRQAFELGNSARNESQQSVASYAVEESVAFSPATQAVISPEKQQEVLRVRELVSAGRYEEAIKRYDAKIAEEPKNVTLFLGRANARFLLGDVSGAEKDIQTAGRLQPQNPMVVALRERLIEGRSATHSIVAKPIESNELAKLGHEAMQRGDGETAYLKYTEAAEAGWPTAFSNFNRAMACTLAGGIAGASNFLGSLDVRLGTPMAINILALRAILERLCDRPGDEEVKELKGAIELRPDFVFAISPLTNLRDGLAARSDPKSSEACADVFALLPGNAAT